MHNEELKHLATEEVQIDAALEKNRVDLESVNPNVEILT
jgi:hypothetical protein